MSVAELPLFTIHGNHDDPSREAAGGGGSEGGTGESILSAIDILAVANLVNYFGAAEDAGDGVWWGRPCAECVRGEGRHRCRPPLWLLQSR